MLTPNTPNAPPLYEWEDVQLDEIRMLEIDYIKTMLDRVLRIDKGVVSAIDMCIEYNGIHITIKKHHKKTMLDRFRDVLDIALDHPIKILGMLTVLRFK
jgi:hypothetical protein